jgi:type IV secretory pathway TrbL component
MKTRTQIPILLLAAGLLCAPAYGWAQSNDSQSDSGRTASGQHHSAKQDMQSAGRETKDAAKDAGHGGKKGTEKAYSSTKSGSKKRGTKPRTPPKAL